MSEDNWFHGKLTREESEKVLEANGLDEGLFLVRESSVSGDFVLSIVHEEEIIHYQIQRRGDGQDAIFSLAEEEKVIHGLDELVYFYLNHPRSGLQHRLTRFVAGHKCPTSVKLHGVENLLHRATQAGNATVVKELLECGNRDIAAKNRDGHCAIHLASFFGHVEVLALLIKHGAKVNVTDSSGYTPLHVACQSNKVEVLEMLLQVKANPTIRNQVTSWVPLHEAAWKGHWECAEALLNSGAPLQPRTSRDETPADLAKANKQFQVANCIDAWPVADVFTHREEWLCDLAITRAEAVKLLHRFPEDGAFLIRSSARKKNIHVLSMVCERETAHFVIELRGIYVFLDSGPYMPSLEHLVDHYSRYADGLPCRLVHPLFSKTAAPLRPLKVALPDVPPRAQNRDRIGTYPANLKPVDNREPYKNHDILRQVRHSRDDIPQEALHLIQVIGEGEYGTVFKGLYMAEEGKAKPVALKALNEVNERQAQSFLKEASNMMELDHHCIVRLIGVCRQDRPMMVLELVPLGSMLDYLRENGHSVRVELEIPLWAAQIAQGMMYLEQKRFIHRDLAARNVLLSSKMQAKISDFGLSIITAEDKDYYQASQGGRWPIKWYAPESANYGTFSHASDVWSYGVLLWEMYSYGDQPYDGMTGAEVIKFIETGRRLIRPPKAELEIFSIMTWCWEYEANKRPSFSECSNFFTSNPEYSNLKELLETQDLGRLICDI